MYTQQHKENAEISRAVAGPSRANGQSVAQFVSSNAQPIQAIFAEISSISRDLWHDDWQRLFESETIDAAQNDNDEQATKKRLEGLPPGNRVKYSQTPDAEQLTQIEQIQAVQDRAEIMYVHLGSDVYVAGRDTEKKPHPTLVGGDPDVTGAGTIRKSEVTEEWGSENVVVTNDSGHFRVGTVPNSTVKIIRGALANDQADIDEDGGGWQAAPSRGRKHKKTHK